MLILDPSELDQQQPQNIYKSNTSSNAFRSLKLCAAGNSLHGSCYALRQPVA